MDELQQQKLYEQRRKVREYWSGYPWWKRALRSIERVNKHLTMGLVKQALGVRNVQGPLDPQKLQSILLLRNDGMGDMALTTPLWHVVKGHFPHIRVGVIGSFRNLPVIENDPNIDRRFDASPGDWKAIRQARREIARETWDVIMPMIYVGRTRMALYAKVLAPKSISSMLIRPGESREDRSKMFSLVVQSPYGGDEVPMIEQMKLHLQGTLAIEFGEDEWVTNLYTDPAANKLVSARIGAILQRHGTSGFIHVNLEARTNFREFGEENSYRVSTKLLERYPQLSVLWTSSPAAAPRAKEYLATQPTMRLEYYETGDLKELMSLVSIATLVISPDTGVIHVAAGFKRPVVGLYATPNEWPPHRTEYRLLFPADHLPVSTIPVTDVVNAAVDLIDQSVRTNASVAARD